MATTEQYSLRWNNFHSNLTSGFHELLEAADMVDVTLAVDGHVLQAHKIVLSICSPYFKQMFRMNPCKHPIVILRDVGHEHMKDILEFMYMGEVSVLRDNLSAFLKTAELLQVKGLTGDDNTSETSPGRDGKLDCDIEEEELTQYNQMLESDVDMSTPYVRKERTQPSTKRNSKNGSSSSSSQNKRSKSETNKKPVSSQPAEVLEAKPPKVELSPLDVVDSQIVSAPEELDDSTKDRQMWDTNSEVPGGEFNNSENGNSIFSIERSGKCGLGGGKQTYQCDKCWKRFSRRDHLRTHEKNIHGEDAGPFVCAICSQLYKNTESLRKHIAKFHFPKDGSAPPPPVQKMEEIRVEN